MADNGHIFYSSVDDNLRLELDARAGVGRNYRTESYLNYMIGKIANVELIAYSNQDHSIDTPSNYLGVLGGSGSRGLDYLPQGYLNPARDYTTSKNGSDPKPQFGASKYNSYRVGPYLKSTNLSTADGQLGIMTTAQVELVVPDPVRDLDYVESVFLRPGRAITLKVQYPEIAVITGNKLTDKIIQPEVKTNKITENLDMNTLIYNMLVISFNMSYQSNGTVTITLHMRGVSSVYTDVTCTINRKTNKDNTDDTAIVSTFYDSIHKEVKTQYDLQEATKKNPEAVAEVKYAFDVKDYEDLNTTRDSWWKVTRDTTSKQQQMYITLGYLIGFINKNIIQEKNKVVTDKLIICNSDQVKSFYVEGIVSADPWKIILNDTDAYGVDSSSNARYLIKPTSVTTDVKFKSEEPGICNPTMIYINLDVINAIEKRYKTDKKKLMVTDLLKEIGVVIKSNTGGMINLELISHPQQPDYLFFYDKQFTPKKEEVIPYPVPMGVRNNESGSLVRDFKIDVKLPTSMQNLMYTVNSGDSISEENIAPHINYMYNNSIVYRTISADSATINDDYKAGTSKTLEDLDKEYEASFTKYDDELKKAKQKYGEDPNNSDNKIKLLTALEKKIQYPSTSIRKSNTMTSPVYPHEVEFTIDGINGLRYGDVLEFNILPDRYKQFATFSIIALKHNIDTSGTWTTIVTCIMRPYIKE